MFKTILLTKLLPIKKTHQFAYNYNFPTLTENRNIKIRSSEFSYLNLEEPITSLNATAMEWKEQQNFEYSLIIRWFVCSPIFLETVYSIPLQVRKKIYYKLKWSPLTSKNWEVHRPFLTKSSRQEPCRGGGGTPHMKEVGMLIVSLRGVNFGFWSYLGCSG